MKEKEILKFKVVNETRYENSLKQDFSIANLKVIKEETIITAEILDDEIAEDIKYAGQKKGCFPDQIGLELIEDKPDSAHALKGGVSSEESL